jgi:hypothetical protein
LTISSLSLIHFPSFRSATAAAVVNGKVQNDVRGAVFQWVDNVDHSGIAIHDDGTYKGNVVADIQIMVAKAIQQGVLQDTDLLQTGVNTIDLLVVAWAESADATFAPQFRCNGDSMHHAVKGTIVIRVEDTIGFEISRNSIVNVDNLSLPSYPFCVDFHAGSSAENPLEQQMGNLRGISVSASRPYNGQRESEIQDNFIRNFDSEAANAIIGIDIQGDTLGVEIERNDVDLDRQVGRSVLDKYVALRIRTNVDASSIRVRDNDFRQEVQDLSANRRLRKSQTDAATRGLESEWELGGCPFANQRGRSPHAAPA